MPVETRSRPGRWWGLCTVLGAVLLPLLSPAGALGQWGIWGMLEQLKTPGVSARTVRQYADMLQLTPEQRAAADDLLFAYEREHRVMTKKYEEIARAIGEEYESDDEVEVWRDVWPKVNKNFIRKAIRLNRGILDDLRVLLDSSQQGHWPAVERLARRDTTLGWGGEPIDKLDLADVVRGLRLDEAAAAAVAPALEQYESDLDRELKARNTFIEGSVDAWFALMTEYNEEKWKKMYEDMRDASKKVAEVNTRHRSQIQAVLPEAAAKEFDLRVRQAMYPKVYRKSYPILVYEAAMRLEGLDSATLEGIRGIHESYEREAAAANEKWANALAEEEARNAENSRGNRLWGWHQEGEKVQEATKARRELDKRTAAALRALLSEEQRRGLPDRKWRPEWDLDSPVSVK